MDSAKESHTTVIDAPEMESSAKRANGADAIRPNASPVDFASDDPENPINWSKLRKWSIVLPVAAMNLILVFATTSIIPAAPQVIRDLHTTSAIYRTLLVSIWELGEGIGPFFVAPLAEKFGRSPVFHVGNLLSIIWAVAGALSTNIQMLVAFRFFNGLATTALTLTPAVVGDLFVPDERGSAMAIAIGMQVLGTFVAPICGSFIAARLGWRWTIWVSAISIAFLALISLLLVRETYAVKLLKRRAARLLKASDDEDLQSHSCAPSNARIFLDAALKPVLITIQSTTVAWITLYTAVVYGVLYLISTTLTEIFESQYAFSNSVVGLAFLSVAIGGAAGMAFFGLTSDRYIKRKRAQEGDAFKKEHRLIHLVLAAALLPLALTLYGWTTQYRVQWIVPSISVGIVGFCTVNAPLATETYLVDAYPVHGASAIAAGVILRAITGAVLPLSGPPLYSHLGFGWGNTTLALVVLIFLPPLVLLSRNGEHFRRRDGLS